MVRSVLFALLASASASQLHYQLEGRAAEDRAHLEARRANLSLHDAVDFLHATRPEAAALLETKHHHHRHTGQAHLRRVHRHSGAVQGATQAQELLNKMIGESTGKLDYERVRCSALQNKLGALMESCQQDLAAFNAQAAAARAGIMRAGTAIESLGQKVPSMQTNLENLNRQCSMDEASLQQQLLITKGDVGLMGEIVDASSCAGGGAALLQCHTDGESFLSFGHHVARQSLAKLSSEDLRARVREALRSVNDSHVTEAVDANQEPIRVEGRAVTVTEAEAPSFVQLAGEPHESGFNSADVRRKAKRCTMSPNPNCKAMNDKFMLMQAEILDKRATLEEQMASHAASCKDTAANYDAQLSNFESRIKAAQTDLAKATQGQNEADEQSRLKTNEHDKLERDYTHGMQNCAKSIDGFEQEACSLAKLRLEVYTKDKKDPPFIADCQVSSWVPQECSRKCGGGLQRLTRTVAAHPVNGAACPALVMERSCNEQPCPVNCKLEEWSGWSSCSAGCGGGVKQRTRSVRVSAEYGGEPCGETSAAESCNVQSCNSDCALGEWTDYAGCSQACGMGFKFRQRPIETPAVGMGSCPKEDEDSRLEFETCNANACGEPTDGAKTLRCEAKLDVILLIDGSGSLGQRGWDAMKKAGELLSDAMIGGDNVHMAALLFSGPDSVEKLVSCSGGGGDAPDMEKDCGIKWVQRLTDDPAAVSSKIGGMAWPGKTTLTSAALSMASAELAFGRRDAQSIVIVFTDGKPMSKRATTQAAKHLRDHARLMWVPVTSNAPVDDIMNWASNPKNDNVIAVEDYDTLEMPETISRIVVDICPDVK